MDIARRLQRDRRATTSIEKVLVVLTLIAIVISAGTLVYVMSGFSGLEGRIVDIENAIKPAPEAEQALMIGTADTIDTFDPAWGATAFEHFVNHIVHEPLLTYQALPSLEVVPALATGYSFSSDYLTCTLNLRRNVTFSNGMPFNATAVKYTFERSIAQNGIGKTFMGPLNYSNPVTIVDDYTIKVNLITPIPAIYPINLAIGFGGSIIFPGANDTEAFKIGTGPYLIKEWKRKQYTVFERNENYWGPKPKLKTITLREYSDPTAMRLALQANEVDVGMATAWSTSDIQALLGKREISSDTPPGGSTRFRFLVFDTKRYPPLNDTKVRQAIAYAIDRDRVLNVGWKGDGEVANTLLAPSLLPDYYSPTWEKYSPSDKTKAKELLTEAGYENGFKIELWYTPSHWNPLDRDVALLIKDDLAQIGIEVEVKSEEWAAFKARRFNPGMAMYLASWVPDYPDPDNLITPMLAGYGFYGASTGYNNSRMNELGRLGASEINETKRIAYYKEMQQIAAEENPIFPLVNMQVWAFYWPYVKNFVYGPLEVAWGNMLLNVTIAR